LGGNKGFENIALEQQHHLAIIVVNASTPEKYKWSVVRGLPGFSDIIGLYLT
jgi:hypothetical protein